MYLPPENTSVSKNPLQRWVFFGKCLYKACHQLSTALTSHNGCLSWQVSLVLSCMVLHTSLTYLCHHWKKARAALVTLIMGETNVDFYNKHVWISCVNIFVGKAGRWAVGMVVGRTGELHLVSILVRKFAIRLPRFYHYN